MIFSLKHDPIPSVLSSLQYGNSGPSCQQVCLVSEQDGQTICTGVSFISLFSSFLTSLIKNCQSQAEILTIIVPVPVHVIKKLLTVLSTGTVVSDNIEDVFSVSEAADILGVAREHWKIGTNDSCCNLTRFHAKTQSLLKRSDYLEPQLSRKNRSTNLNVENVFICDICGISITSSVCLITHYKIKHASTSLTTVADSFAQRVEGKKYACNLCDYTARDKYNIRIHMERKHELSSGYRCSFCKKSLKTKQDLSHHKSICDLGPSLSTKDISKKEKVEEVFICYICGISFKSKRCLITHYKFKHASTSSATPQDVVDSYAQRVEGGKYVCNLCTYTSRDKYNVRLHIERKHGLTSGYKCSF